MKTLRESLRKKWSDNANILGLIFGLTALILLLPGILSDSRLGTVDNGRYELLMEDVGLEYLAEDLENSDTLSYNRVIEEYDYGKFSVWQLLSPSGLNSAVYPIALIRLVTQPFGLHFSTQYLAILYAFMFACSIYMLVRGFGHLGGWLAAIPGALLLLAAGSRNLAAFFNSLYSVGTVVVGLLLMAATALRLFTYGRKRLGRSLALFLAAAVFGLNSSEISVIFAPFAIAVVAGALVMARKNGGLRLSGAVCAVLVLLAAVHSSAQYQQNSANTTSNASVYQSAFNGFLEASDDPVADLAEFGLDESYAEDVGKSYYLSEDSYTHCPRDEAEASVLFDKLNADTIGAWYLRHPLRLLQTANRLGERYNHFESDVVLQVGQTNTDAIRTTRAWSVGDTLLKLLLPENYSGACVLMLLTLAAAVWLTVRLKNRCGWLLSLLLGAAALTLGIGSFGYLLSYLRYMGREFLPSARIVCVFGMLLSAGMVCVAAGDAAGAVSAWFRAKQEQPVVRYGLSNWCDCLLPRQTRNLQGSGRLVERICESRSAGIFCVFLLAAAMSCVVQLVPVRAGCVNNGDFGRMMDQLEIIWQGDIYYNVSAQLGRRVIEDYAYLGDFDWTTLTSLNPRYSLVYFAAVVRLIGSWLGQDFSTWHLSMVMNVVLVACIVSITYDLYDLMKRYALLLGLLLCGAFLCEGYLVWFNSLFGESCMFLGLFMVAACCVHLAVRPANRCWPTVLLLLFSVRIMTCAKAQMLVTLPFLLVLAVIFALYQRPLSIKGLIPYTLAVMIGCVLICVDCVTVYNDNANISERQTVWQSTFYGALMISDDPESTMEELGIDTRMLPDVGKDAYQSDEDYVISPNSEEADAALYDHVNTFTMVKYYLRHPIQLLKMLNHAAQVSRTMYSGFRAYLGQDYAGEHDEVNRLGLWQYWRSYFTCGSFLGYVLLYGAAAAVCIFGILRKKGMDVRIKMLAILYLGIMLVGAAQYPLSVIGNGFADNQKQMFGFMLCHDFLVLFTLAVALCWLKAHGREWLGKICQGKGGWIPKRRSA